MPVARAKSRDSSRVLQGSSKKAMRSRHAGLTYLAKPSALARVQLRLASSRSRRSGSASSSTLTIMPSRTASYSPTFTLATFSPGKALNVSNSSSGSPVHSGALRKSACIGKRCSSSACAQLSPKATEGSALSSGSLPANQACSQPNAACSACANVSRLNSGSGAISPHPSRSPWHSCTTHPSRVFNR